MRQSKSENKIVRNNLWHYGIVKTMIKIKL